VKAQDVKTLSVMKAQDVKTLSVMKAQNVKRFLQCVYKIIKTNYSEDD